MLSILNKLILKYINIKNTATTKQQIKHKIPLLEPGIEPEISRTQSGCVTSAPTNQLRIAVVVKLFNCFDAMDRKVNKQSRVTGHIFFTNSFFFL